ncbi:MAG TPA: hypothetical protein GXX28_03175 [Firmicutes bacterium]|nr:hypothetical protein [Bacillota bacterium]
MRDDNLPAQTQSQDDVPVSQCLECYESVVLALPDDVTPNGELDNAFDFRDDIIGREAELSPSEKERLARADALVRKYASRVHKLIDPDYRRNAHKPRAYWWWWVGEKEHPQ